MKKYEKRLRIVTLWNQNINRSRYVHDRKHNTIKGYKERHPDMGYQTEKEFESIFDGIKNIRDIGDRKKNGNLISVQNWPN